MTDDTAFLELDDLNTPLPFPSEASGSAHLRTANSVAPYTCYDSYEQFCREENFFGAAQNVSALNQLPPLPESLGSHFDSLKVPLCNVVICNTSFSVSLSHIYTHTHMLPLEKELSF